MSRENTRIIFMGTPEFAVPSLKALHEGGFQIVGVITTPDRKGGRGRKKTIVSAVKSYALEQGLHLLQPRNLKDPNFLAELAALNADLQMVVAFRMLPEAVWAMPPLGTINLHGSLLPAYRGAAPINWAIINGESETGLTTFFIEKQIDTGEVLAMRKVEIGDRDTAGILHDRMMDIGAELVLDTVRQVINHESKPVPQEHSRATKAPKIFHEDCCIDFDRSAREVYNFVRGLSPYPGAWTRLDGKQLKIYWLEPIEFDLEEDNGIIIRGPQQRLMVKSADDWLEIKELQLEGRRRMSAETFLNGYDLVESEIRNMTK